jgi:hypothetical protein
VVVTDQARSSSSNRTRLVLSAAAYAAMAWPTVRPPPLWAHQHALLHLPDRAPDR